MCIETNEEKFMDKLDKELLKEVLKLSLCTTISRREDVTLHCGDSVATVDADSLIELDYALALLFNLDSDDITFENIQNAFEQLRNL